jgi:serine phosphatase RsbU (regulator of sigma subunit)
MTLSAAAAYPGIQIPVAVSRRWRVAGAPTYVTPAEDLRLARQRPTAEAARASVDRAVGLLAGRTRSRLSEAHRHLLRMAADQGRDVTEVAAGVIELFDAPGPATAAEPPPAAAALRSSGPVATPGRDPGPAAVQRVLDAIPGATALLTPVRDDTGRLVDLVFAAASPEAAGPDGRRGAWLAGVRLAAAYPDAMASGRWTIYAEVLATGEPAEIPRFGVREGVFTSRVHRLGDALLISWIRQDGTGADRDRVTNTERLGNLGWGEWDLISGEVRWSDQLYRIYERDPALGPMTRAESDALAVEDDRPLRAAAVDAFARAERVDITTRVRINGRIKHLRTVVDAARDATGRPLRVYGIVQDVTERETGAQRLAEVERQLAEQRRTLAAEHELAAQLQKIVLPLPDGPVELPGLQVALRYLPAGQESLVGGDWYHAGTLHDGSVLLAVGDVAGHGTPAATTMAQLRHALRALAVTTTDPGELLGQLNRLTCDLERENPELSATAVVARYEPRRRRLVWARAGHPPPLLSRRGRTAPLERPGGPVLGVVDGARYGCATLDLAPGDVLLFYTDGLVEHRRRGPDDGLAALTAAIDEAVAASPAQPMSALLERLHRANPDDDTCILAARPR